MTILQVNPIDDARWQQLITTRCSNLFHSPAWLRGIQQTYGMEPSALLMLDADANPVAGLPYFHISDILGERIIALPFSDYCDAIVESAEQWEALTRCLLDRQIPMVLRCLHNDIPLQDSRFTLYNRAKWHGMDIRAEEDSLWSQLHSSARRAVRKAEKNGISIRVAETKADLEAFFRMHLRIRKYKYRLLAQPYRFFENIWENCIATGKGVVILAMYRNMPIAGTMFLEWKDVLVYKFSVSDAEYLAHRPADLIVWEAVRYAKQRNLTSIDFGLSDWDQEGLIRFKNKFATEEKTLSFLMRPVHGLPTESQKMTKQMLHRLTSIFTDDTIPDDITNKAGELLYQYFS